MVIGEGAVHFGSSTSRSTGIAMGFEIRYNLTDLPGTDLSIHRDIFLRHHSCHTNDNPLDLFRDGFALWHGGQG